MVTRSLRFFGAAGLVLFFDQLTKLLVTDLERSVSFGIGEIVFVENFGAGFGILQGQTAFLLLVSFLVGIGLLWYVFSGKSEPGEDLLLGILFGGLLGNFVDRVVRGFVVDFISFSFWPAFNIADSAITLSVVGLLILSFKREKEKN